MKENVFNKKFLSYVSTNYESSTFEINPYYMMRFDCRSINDILTFYPNQDTLLIAAACNDSYIKIFDFKEMNMIACLKGVFGAPLSLDISSDKNLLAAGFEDEDEEEGSEAKAHAPIDGTVIVQIQSGVMYHPTQQLVQLAHMPTIRLVIPLENSSVRSQEFHPFIFHPPAITAA